MFNSMVSIMWFLPMGLLVVPWVGYSIGCYCVGSSGGIGGCAWLENGNGIC